MSARDSNADAEADIKLWNRAQNLQMDSDKVNVHASGHPGSRGIEMFTGVNGFKSKNSTFTISSGMRSEVPPPPVNMGHHAYQGGGAPVYNPTPFPPQRSYTAYPQIAPAPAQFPAQNWEGSRPPPQTRSYTYGGFGPSPNAANQPYPSPQALPYIPFPAGAFPPFPTASIDSTPSQTPFSPLEEGYSGGGSSYMPSPGHGGASSGYFDPAANEPPKKKEKRKLKNLFRT